MLHFTTHIKVELEERQRTSSLSCFKEKHQREALHSTAPGRFLNTDGLGIQVLTARASAHVLNTEQSTIILGILGTHKCHSINTTLLPILRKHRSASQEPTATPSPDALLQSQVTPAGMCPSKPAASTGYRLEHLGVQHCHP